MKVDVGGRLLVDAAGFASECRLRELVALMSRTVEGLVAEIELRRIGEPKSEG